MANQHLATYLNDHLAGAAAAVELLAHLEKAHAGTPTETFCAGLRAEITADRGELEAIMGRLQVGASTSRKIGAWFAEKLTQLKLHLDDRSGGDLLRFEALEALSVGIEGKRLLWRALATVSEGLPALRGTDYTGLVRRAEEQRGRVEAVRLEAARAALGGAT